MKTSGLVLGVVLVLVAGRELMARNVEYVLPDDFRGFVNVLEEAGGIELKPSLEGLVIEVPQSGRLGVKSIDLLRKWNVVEARYASGKPLKVFVRNAKHYEESDFGFWLMGVPAGERLYAFVGRRDEMEAFVQQHEGKIYRSPPVDP
jgi:hypothetical protein